LQLKSSELKVIALDFDGTLVESNLIKDRAFKAIFSDWPEHTDTMMRWHLAHDSIERVEKFRYFVEEVLELSGRKDLIEKLTAKFGELTKDAIIGCPFVKGAEDFLEYIRNRYFVYLVSATPQKDLEQIIEAIGLNGYFKKVYGAPIKKAETLDNIMKTEKVTVNEIMYIGDSPEDQQCAKDLGIYFIGRQSDRVLNRSAQLVFTDFDQIKSYLSNYLEVLALC
jgi:phosphoglycolate phosphatase-like HAD superfamily hydrolase